MTLWQGILLGLVQGLAEFLPVSSSGHLRVLEVVTGVRTPSVFVEVTLHVATLAAVLVVYGRRLVELLGGAIRGRPAELRLVGLLAIATVPAGVVGGLFHHQVEEAATPLVFIGAAFIVTGFMNWSTRGRGGGGGGGGGGHQARSGRGRGGRHRCCAGGGGRRARHFPIGIDGVRRTVERTRSRGRR